MARGYVKKRALDQRDTCYLVGKKHPRGKEYLRVREQDGEARLEHHLGISNIETEELETTIGDASRLHQILGALGFTPQVVVEKHREEWRKDDVLVTLDTVKHLGDFVEIEMQGTLSEEIEQKLYSLAETLELKKEIKDVGYAEMLTS